MYQFTCSYCGDRFTAKSTLAKFCSSACRGAARDLANCVPCGDCGELMFRPRHEHVGVCRTCRGRRTERHGTPSGRSGHQRRGEEICELCRLAWNEYSREAGSNLRARGWIRPSRRDIPEVICAYCGEPLLRRSDGAKLHKTCRRFHDRAVTKRKLAAARLAVAAQGVSANLNNPFTAGVCLHCDEPFVRRNTPSAYCSGKCRRADKPQPVRPSTRRMIFERDDWICRICLEPIDRSARWDSDWSATVDHIIPQSRGGGHEVENLRTAHRWCNSVRGDETYYTEADLRLTQMSI